MAAPQRAQGEPAVDDADTLASTTSGSRYRPLIRPEQMLVLATRQLERDTDPRTRASTLFQRGKAQLFLGHDDEALSDFDDALRWLPLATADETSPPRDGEGTLSAALVHFYKGFCYARVGHHERAVNEYSDALEGQPKFARALYERAASHNALGHFDAAIEDYEAALACDQAEESTRRRREGSGSVGSLLDAPTTQSARKPRSHFAEARQRGQPIDAIYAELAKLKQASLAKQAVERLESKRTANPAPVPLDAETYDSATSLPADDAASLTADMSCSASTTSDRADCANNASLMAPMEPDEDCTAVGAADPADVLSRTSSVDEMSDLVSIDSAEDSAHVYYQRGLYHRRRGKLADAITMYSKAIELDGHHLKAHFNRAFCHEKLGHLDAAVADYTATLRIDARNAYAWYNLGIAYDGQGQYERAIECFTRAIEIEPHSADFYHNRGYSRRKCGSYKDAIDDYTQAIRIDPKHFKSHFNRAFCHDKMANNAAAVADYSSALAIDASNVGAYFNRGIAHERLQQLEDAMADYATAARLDPHAVYALNAYALVLDHLGRYTEAARAFTQAIALDPGNARLYHNRGYTHRNLGELEKAVQDYTAALAHDPTLLAAYSNRAFVLRKLGRYAEAAHDYSQVAEECPEERLKALNSRAYCHARLERYEDAIQDYTRVIALDRFNTHALHNRGISYDKAGFHREAIDDFSRCIQLAPDSPSSANAYYSRGTSYLALDQLEDAARDLDMAMRLDVAAELARQGDDSTVTPHALRKAHPAYPILRRLRGHRHHTRTTRGASHPHSRHHRHVGS